MIFSIFIILSIATVGISDLIEIKKNEIKNKKESDLNERKNQ